ncbi:MAG: T9SS type A sorting domain-containing protein [Taibaiella sp.]|jgi:hypothetical protein
MRFIKIYLPVLVSLFISYNSFAQTPFTCSTPTYFMTAQMGSDMEGVDSMRAYQLDPTTGQATRLSDDFYPGHGGVDGIGFNVTDNFIWGKKGYNGADTIVRIASDWTITKFGITGMPAVPFLSSFEYAGAINTSGVYYLQRADSTAPCTRIDLNPSSPTYLQLIDTLSLGLGVVFDWDFNPIDGNLYTVLPNRSLIRINPSNGSSINLGTISGAGVSNNSFPSQFFDGTGALYIIREDAFDFIDSAQANIYKIANVSTGNTVAQYVGNLGYDDYNNYQDATRCLSVALPLELLSFSLSDATWQGVLLNWTTRAEMNVDYFAVERSADGRTWGKIGKVQANGTDTKLISAYSFHDKEPLKGHNLYRLKMTDRDGTYTYSPVRSIGNTLPESTKIYPNPATNIVNIETAEGSRIAVYNMMGQCMNVPAKSNGSLSTLDVSALSVGQYIIRVIDNVSNSSSYRLTIVK